MPRRGESRATRGGILFERIYFFTATGLALVKLRTAFAQDITARRLREPVLVWSDGQRRWW